MLRRRQMMAQRGAGQGATAREIDIPLPLSGLFVKSNTAEISGLYAATLENIRSDGTQLEIRRPALFGAADDTSLQRVPFAFGTNPRYLSLNDGYAATDGATFARHFNGQAMTAYISSNVVIADGLDNPMRYDGTAFSESLWTTDTGASAANFDGIVAHQDRLYFWKRGGTLEFYYADDVGAVMGGLTRFPLDRLGNLTGGIETMASLTIDAGDNANDALAIFTTTGDIVVYEGLDPGDPNGWSLSMRLKSAPPLSRFGMTRVGPDIWFITANGIVSMSETLSRGILSMVSDISLPIADHILALARIGGGEWQMHTAADGSRIIVNHYKDGTAVQFIYDTQSRTWSTENLPARMWHNLALDTQFTTGGGVLGTLVAEGDSAEMITARLYTGWFRMPQAGQIASITPTIIANGPMTVTVAVLSDHDDSAAAIADATQTVTINPDDDPNQDGRVALDDLIAIGAVGSVFQLRIEVTAAWAKFVSLRAGVI